MANKGKRRQIKQAINTVVPNSNATEYDVKERISKFHSYNSRKQNGYSASTNSFSNLETSPSGRVVNSNVSISTPTDTGSLYNEYTRLDDKITNYSNQNELAHNDLRKELENKIEKAKGDVEISINKVHDLLKDKLSYKWFAAAVTVLIAIAGIIYNLSYSRQSDYIEKSAVEISNIKQENSKMQKDIEYIKKDIEEIKERNKNLPNYSPNYKK